MRTTDGLKIFKKVLYFFVNLLHNSFNIKKREKYVKSHRNNQDLPPCRRQNWCYSPERTGSVWVLEFDGFRVGSYDLWKAEELMEKWLEPETAEAERLDILGLGS